MATAEEGESGVPAVARSRRQGAICRKELVRGHRLQEGKLRRCPHLVMEVILDPMVQALQAT